MNELYGRLGTSNAPARLFEAFYYPSVFKRTADAVAAKIIKNKDIWMRKSHDINDYRELEHRQHGCLMSAHHKHRDKLCALMDSIYPRLCAELETLFAGRMLHFRANACIAYASEQNKVCRRIGANDFLCGADNHHHLPL